MWLYKLTNSVNGKAYVGISVNPISHRISRHVYDAKRGRTDMAISMAIKKYGIDAFAIEEIGRSDDYAELLNMEAEAIVAHNTRRPNGYNVTAGGMGARRACSQETRDRISERTKGRVPWNFGKRNEDTIRRYAHRGNLVRKPDGKKPWNFGLKTGPMSEEQKKQIAETVRKIRAAKFWSTRTKSVSGGI